MVSLLLLFEYRDFKVLYSLTLQVVGICSLVYNGKFVNIMLATGGFG